MGGGIFGDFETYFFKRFWLINTDPFLFTPEDGTWRSGLSMVEAREGFSLNAVGDMLGKSVKKYSHIKCKTELKGIEEERTIMKSMDTLSNLSDFN